MSAKNARDAYKNHGKDIILACAELERATVDLMSEYVDKPMPPEIARQLLQGVVAMLQSYEGIGRITIMTILGNVDPVLFDKVEKIVTGYISDNGGNAFDVFKLLGTSQEEALNVGTDVDIQDMCKEDFN